MELSEFLHMNEGDGELSYSQNSFLQKGVSLMTQPMLERAIQSLISEDKTNSQQINVADLGCGVGPVPLAFVSMVIQNIQSTKKCKEIQIYLNDLPSNDFNLLFRDLFKLELLPKGKNGDEALCLLMAVPGSYYERLFPTSSLHLVHANYTLHWLSQAPAGLYNKGCTTMNKGNIYISKTSPKEVAEAYLVRFQQDLTRFLKCRSKEVVAGGRMLLTFRGRPSSTNGFSWQPWELEIFAQAIASLVSQGLMEEENLDSFNVPFYGASKEEIEEIVEKEGTFTMKEMKAVSHPVADEIEDTRERAEAIGKFTRAFTESLISSHFEIGHKVMDALYDEFTNLTFHHLANHEPPKHYTIIIVLGRNH